MVRYLDILADMTLKINEGHYLSGQKLPSVREAAKLYGCSVGTITRAYSELEKRHAVYSIAQSGYYVVEKQRTRPAAAENSAIDFASASPDPRVFPYLDFQHCLNKAVDLYQSDLFACGDPRGLEQLRRALVPHLASDQVFAREDQIMIMSCIHQALEILAKMPFPNGKSVILVEQPSYDNFLRLIEAERIPVCGIARSAAGIDMRELEEKFRHGGIKFFYTMPRHHNPLGTSFNADERKAIARLASKYDVYVVEDDYMTDLGGDASIDPIFAFNDTSRVVYLKSFSKIIFPGLRIGAAVLPEKLLGTFREYKRYADTSLLPQAALELYIKNGMYERHKRKICGQYTARMHALHEAVRRHNEAGLLELAEVRSGVYAQLKLPQTVNLEQLTRRLAAKEISVVSGKPFYLSDYREREKFLRLGISRTLPEQIERGVQEIAEAVRREVRLPSS